MAWTCFEPLNGCERTAAAAAAAAADVDDDDFDTASVFVYFYINTLIISLDFLM